MRWKPLGQDVHQEAPDELVGRQRHRLVAARPFDPVILPLEGDAVVVGRDQPAIGDGDAVGVARQVGEHGLRPAERLLGIDHPLGLAQRCEEGGECSGVGEAAAVTEELQASGLVGCEELAPGTIAGTGAREPALAGKSPGRHDTQRAPSEEMPPPGTIMCTCG